MQVPTLDYRSAKDVLLPHPGEELSLSNPLHGKDHRPLRDTSADWNMHHGHHSVQKCRVAFPVLARWPFKDCALLR